jgi:hypothetical protein
LGAAVANWRALISKFACESCPDPTRLVILLTLCLFGRVLINASSFDTRVRYRLDQIWIAAIVRQIDEHLWRRMSAPTELAALLTAG